MKQTILILSLLILSGYALHAQVSLAHTFSGSRWSEAEVVNLSLSGKKIMVLSPVSTDSMAGTGGSDTISFYNLDYSFWKRIICPYVPGLHIAAVGAVVSSIAMYYPSETLFNTDPLLEIAVTYLSNTDVGKILIINETGTIVDSMPNLYAGGSNFNLYGGYMRIYEVDTLGIGYQAIIRNPSGISVYNLPGTLPCNTCSGNGMGIAKNGKPADGIQTQPLPNPSVNEVKITFKLPEGANEANLVLYSTTGQKIKSYTVDNRFGYILLDNSQLASGVYYYNIEVNGTVSSTQKMVVVK